MSGLLVLHEFIEKNGQRLVADTAAGCRLAADVQAGRLHQTPGLLLAILKHFIPPSPYDVF